MVSGSKQKSILGTNSMIAVTIVAIQRQVVPRLSGAVEFAVSILVGPFSVAVDDYPALVLLEFQWAAIIHTSDAVPLISNL